ncbi:MAG TPA: hypothetical protein PLU97_01290, partial [Candidatus Cryptobacteroides sp.]|nr:hypothetical protein [Candidatus Cryptobacteroides sp.]
MRHRLIAERLARPYRWLWLTIVWFHDKAKKAENVIAPHFFAGGLSKKGQKCLTMKRKWGLR